MIYAVTEWYDNTSYRFYFDSSKVDLGNPFEAAYLGLLQKASAMRNRMYTAVNNAAIAPRFGAYQNGMASWNKLMAKPPCRINAEVSLVMAGH